MTALSKSHDAPPEDAAPREELGMDALLDLARDRSAESRNQLVQTVGDLFVEGGDTLSRSECDHMGAILRQLVSDVERDVRQSLASKIASDTRVPSELAAMLANDDISVAHEILLKSPVLKDLELIEIVRHKTMQHRLAIANREQVSERVSDALVVSGEMPVLQALLANEGAQISPTAMNRLVDMSENVDVLQEPLINRDEMGPALARRMYWWVSAALRKHIAGHYDIDVSTLDSKIVHTVKDILGEPDTEQITIAGPDDLANRLAETGELAPHLMIECLRRGEIPMFEAMFSRYSGLRKTLIRRFLFEAGGEGLAIACKGCDIGKSDYATMFLLSRGARPGDKVVDPSELSKAIKFYGRIKPDAAVQVVERWKLDPDYLYALKQVDEDEKKSA